MTDTIDAHPSLAPNSRYLRPRLTRLISWTGLLLGMLAGLGGGLYYTWALNPLELDNIHPYQLDSNTRAQYIALVAVSFNHNSDLQQATDRLLAVVPRGQDPFEEVANVACVLAQTGYVSSNSGIRAVRSMTTLYQLQGRSGCADELSLMAAAPTPIVTAVLATPTEPPPPTKTPTLAPSPLPTNTPLPVFVPTEAPAEEYVLINVQTFCNTNLSGLIEVFVQDFNGTGIPGSPVRVRWDGGEDTFYTGLKPERGAAYADFAMEDGIAYTIDMPNRSEPSSRQLTAVPCTTDTGDRAVTSYRVVFRPTG